MPNAPRADNPGRVIRIDARLWAEVQVFAEATDTTPSAVVREAVRRYVKRHKVKPVNP